MFRHAFSVIRKPHERYVRIADAYLVMEHLLGPIWPQWTMFSAFLLVRQVLVNGVSLARSLAVQHVAQVQSITRDQWINLVDFAEISDYSTFSFADPWPLLIDRFVEWVQSNVPLDSGPSVGA
jgi:hypothetical protein